MLYHTLGFPGGASGKEPTCQCRRHKRCGFDLGQRRSPGGGHGNPHQYSCLENPMDRGAWWVTAHRAAESDTTEATQHPHTYHTHTQIWYPKLWSIMEYKRVNWHNIQIQTFAMISKQDCIFHNNVLCVKAWLKLYYYISHLLRYLLLKKKKRK